MKNSETSRSRGASQVTFVELGHEELEKRRMHGVVEFDIRRAAIAPPREGAGGRWESLHIFELDRIPVFRLDAWTVWICRL
jgi:hypothetical protein